ncbi:MULTISPECIES: helix-turn-helix domain-containing protein [Chitinophagaceae]
MKEKVDTLTTGLFSKFSVSEDFYINRISDHFTTYHRYLEKPHRHSSVMIIYFTSGSGTHDIDFKRYEVKPGSAFILTPGQIHAWELSEDAEGYILFHSEWLFNDKNSIVQELQRFRGQKESLSSIFVPVLQNKLTDLLECMVNEYLHKKFGSKIYLASLITQVYLELLRVQVENNAIADTQKIYYMHYQAFERRLESEFKTHRKVAYYASRLNMTPKHLNRVVQSITGKSATEVILERVLLEAQRMVVNTDWNLTQIATDLGYEDYTHFSHIFKKKTGSSPSDFKREILYKW